MTSGNYGTGNYGTGTYGGATTTPVPYDAFDLAMIPAMDAWAATITSTTSKAGKAKAAYLKWKTAHA